MPTMRWFKEVYNAWFVGIIGVALGRFLLILQRPYAVFYNVFAVVLLGGFGMWVTLLLYSHGSAQPEQVCLSILTYSVAIVGMSLLDALWRQNATRPIQILSVCIALAAILPPANAAWRFFGPSSSLAGAEGFDPYSGNIFFNVSRFIFLPAVCWLFVNVDDQRFDNDPYAAVGGNPLRAL